MQGLGKSMKRKLVQAAAVATIALALGAAPAQAVLDEDGGAAQSGPTVQISDGAFDWGDAGIGIAIGAGAGALAVGTTLVLRRSRDGSQDAARPAVQ